MSRTNPDSPRSRPDVRTRPREPESKALTELREKVQEQLQSLSQEIEKDQKGRKESEDKTKVNMAIVTRYQEVFEKLFKESTVEGSGAEGLRKEITSFMTAFPEQHATAMKRLDELSAGNMPQGEAGSTMIENVDRMFVNALRPNGTLAPMLRMFGITTEAQLRDLVKTVREGLANFLSTFKTDRPGLLQTFARSQGRNLQWSIALDNYRVNRGMAAVPVRNPGDSPLALAPASALENRLNITRAVRERWTGLYNTYVRAKDADANSAAVPPTIEDALTEESAKTYTDTVAPAPAPTALGTPEAPPAPVGSGIEAIPATGLELTEAAPTITLNVNGTPTSFRRNSATPATFDMQVGTNGRWLRILDTGLAPATHLHLMPPAAGTNIQDVVVRLNNDDLTAPNLVHRLGPIVDAVRVDASAPTVPGQRINEVIIRNASTLDFNRTAISPEEVKTEAEAKGKEDARKKAEEADKKTALEALSKTGTDLIGPTLKPYLIAGETYNMRVSTDGVLTVRGPAVGATDVSWRLTHRTFTSTRFNIANARIAGGNTGDIRLSATGTYTPPRILGRQPPDITRRADRVIPAARIETLLPQLTNPATAATVQLPAGTPRPGESTPQPLDLVRI